MTKQVHNKKNLSERIKAIEASVAFINNLEHLTGLTPREIWKTLGITKQYYSLIKTGGQVISMSMLHKCRGMLPEQHRKVVEALCVATIKSLLTS